MATDSESNLLNLEHLSHQLPESVEAFNEGIIDDAQSDASSPIVIVPIEPINDGEEGSVEEQKSESNDASSYVDLDDYLYDSDDEKKKSKTIKRRSGSNHNCKHAFLYVCKFCNKAYRYEKALKTHVAIHGAMKKCELCCQTFRSEEELTNHTCLTKRREQNPDVNYSESRTNKKIAGEELQEPTNGVKTEAMATNGVDIEDDIQSTVLPISQVKSELDPFVCTICLKRYKYLRALETHMKTHEESASEEDVGAEDVEEEPALDNVNTSIPNALDKDVKFFECYICEKRYKYLRSLETHLMQHEEAVNKPHDVLAECSNLRKSVRNEDTQYACPICADMFHASDLPEHIDTHKTEHSHKCSHCDNTFKRSTSLAAHVREKHTNICMVCSESFDNERLLKKHIHASHGNYIPRKPEKLKPAVVEPEKFSATCDRCKITFSDLSLFNAHMMLHISGVDPKVVYNDTDDNAEEIENYDTNIEMLDFNIKKEVIDTSYEEAQQEVQQEAQQEARPPVNKPFCCTVCPKRFISQNALNGHKAVHSRTAAKQSEDLQGVLNNIMKSSGHFGCNICGEKFADRTILRAHQKTHMNSRLAENQRKENNSMEDEFAIEAVGQPTFGTIGSLRKPSDVSSTMNEDIHCPMCDLAGFKSQTEFDLHFLTHEAEFTEIGKVQPHQRTHSTPIAWDSQQSIADSFGNASQSTTKHNRHKCFVCKRGFHSEMVLKTHMFNAHNGYQYIPNNSNKQTTPMYEHDISTKCLQCGIVCVDQSDLEQHMSVHEGTDSQRVPINILPTRMEDSVMDSDVVFAKPSSLAGDNYPESQQAKGIVLRDASNYRTFITGPVNYEEYLYALKNRHVFQQFNLTPEFNHWRRVNYQNAYRRAMMENNSMSNSMSNAMSNAMGNAMSNSMSNNYRSFDNVYESVMKASASLMKGVQNETRASNHNVDGNRVATYQNYPKTSVSEGNYTDFNKASLSQNNYSNLTNGGSVENKYQNVGKVEPMDVSDSEVVEVGAAEKSYTNLLTASTDVGDAFQHNIDINAEEKKTLKKAKQSSGYMDVVPREAWIKNNDGVMTEAPKPPKYQCPKCDERFAHKHVMERHKKKHSYETVAAKPFDCPICGETFPRKNTYYKLHMRSHKSRKVFPCDLCDKKFTKKVVLGRHKMLHALENKFKCRFCDETFSRGFQVVNHEREKHTGLKYLQCPKCPEKFESHKVRKEHLLEAHPTEYNCQYCDVKDLGNYQVYIKHLSLHTGVKRYKCPVCSKEFPKIRTFQYHYLGHKVGPMPSADTFTYKTEPKLPITKNVANDTNGTEKQSSDATAPEEDAGTAEATASTEATESEDATQSVELPEATQCVESSGSVDEVVTPLGTSQAQEAS